MDLLLCFVLIFLHQIHVSAVFLYLLLYRASKHAVACSTKKYLALTRHFYQHTKATQLPPFHWCKNQDSNMVCMDYAWQGNSAVCSQAECHTHPLEMGHSCLPGTERSRERRRKERHQNITPWGFCCPKENIESVVNKQRQDQLISGIAFREKSNTWLKVSEKWCHGHFPAVSCAPIAWLCMLLGDVVKCMSRIKNKTSYSSKLKCFLLLLSRDEVQLERQQML